LRRLTLFKVKAAIYGYEESDPGTRYLVPSRNNEYLVGRAEEAAFED